MRQAARIDANQPDIIKALRSVGASVQPLHTVGAGCVDLAVGFRGANYLLEVKDGRQPPSKRRLTPDEEKWHAEWRGHVAVVNSVDEALQEIGAVDEYRA